MTYKSSSIVSKENSLRFPKRIYYTATPQQVRAYRAESQRLAKEAASAALPLESDTNDDDYTATLDEFPTSKSKHSVTRFDKKVAQSTQSQVQGVGVG